MLMGNSVIVLLASSHDLMHGSVIRNPRLNYWIGLIGLAIGWMPPTLWKAVHNREHHSKTNSLSDPDRGYLKEQPNTWAKWVQNQITPSSEVHPLGLMLGMGMTWGLYSARNLTSVLLFNHRSVSYVPASFAVSSKERWAIARELLLIFALHLSVIAYLGFSPIQLALGYFLPIAIGYGIAIFYVFTNHMLCEMTDVNDPLINSVSLRVPKLVNLLHFNFSHHTEHHIFPGMNSNYYPLLQELLKTHYPERFNLIDAGQAWHLLMQTPRHYQSNHILTDWSGEKSVSCPLIQTLERD